MLKSNGEPCSRCAGRARCLIGRQGDAFGTAMASRVTERAFQKGEVLLGEGQLPTVIQVVKVGMVMLTRRGEDGVSRPIGLSGWGQPVGSTAVLGLAAPMSCVAVTAGRCCQVEMASLQAAGLLDMEFMSEVARDFVRTSARVADWARVVRIKGLTGQLAGTLLQISRMQGSNLIRLPSHTTLASLLATTRETIARALRQLELQHCLLRHDRWHCEVLPEPLCRWIESTG
ncbi:MAG: Crp/Fnr family transcriptional regulator [Curvibacter sp.]|nr:Crp/Fnr family transcriptional regulator [Curvibacter sp.]